MEPKQKDKYRTYRILLLEDDANSAEIVTRSLEKYNIHIDHVANARLAVSKLKNKYDLIISDVMMPIMDGFTFIEKHREEIQNTPIIILTALQEKEDILKAAALRITHYLVKPFEQAKLVNKVIEAMGIDPSFLILKKDYPFSISHDVIDESSIKLIIKGFATPSQFRTALPNYIMQLKTYSNNIKDFTIFVTGDFNYTSSAIELLDGMIQELIDSFSTRENHILLKGDFFQKVAPEDIVKTKWIRVLLSQNH